MKKQGDQEHERKEVEIQFEGQVKQNSLEERRRTGGGARPLKKEVGGKEALQIKTEVKKRKEGEGMERGGGGDDRGKEEGMFVSAACY